MFAFAYVMCGSCLCFLFMFVSIAGWPVLLGLREISVCCAWYKCSISATPVGKLLQFHKGDGLATEWFSVLDYKQWRSYEVLVKPPAHVIAHGMAPGVGLVAADAVPLLHRCASLGFKDVGVSCLNRLLRLVPAGTFKQQPTLLIETVFALVSWLLPKHTDWELICNMREPKAPTKPLIAAGSSLPDEVMDTSDKLELQKEQNKCDDEVSLLVVLFCHCLCASVSVECC